MMIRRNVDNPLFLARDVADWIEHTDLSRMVGLVDEDEKLKETLFTSGQNREMWFLTERGLKQVLANSRKIKAFRLLREIDDEYRYKTTPKEIEFLYELELALKPFDLKGLSQYTVLNYKLDYYIPNLNMAIEYDENNHASYSNDRQEIRQQNIEREINCNFIRLSDSEPHSYNIGLVFKEILKTRERL